VAQYNLGHIYEQGLGVLQSIPTAIIWYEKAAASGDEDARAALHRLNATGHEG